MRERVVYGLRVLWWVIDAMEKLLTLVKTGLEGVIYVVDDWPGGKEKD